MSKTVDGGGGRGETVKEIERDCVAGYVRARLGRAMFFVTERVRL